MFNFRPWLRNKVGTRNDARHRCATMYAYKPYSGQVHQQDCYQGWGTICVKPNGMYTYIVSELVIFQLCHSENKLIFNEMMMRSALY